MFMSNIVKAPYMYYYSTKSSQGHEAVAMNYSLYPIKSRNEGIKINLPKVIQN